MAAAPGKRREAPRRAGPSQGGGLSSTAISPQPVDRGEPTKDAPQHHVAPSRCLMVGHGAQHCRPPPSPTLQQPGTGTDVSAAGGADLASGWQIEGLPDIILRAGPKAAERTVEFFTAQIRNPHTRAAYGTAVTRFFTWCDARGLELAQISPVAVAAYIDDMHDRYRAPTIKQHLAAIRRLFDWLVTGQVMPTNPAASVRGPTHVVRTGKTPVLQPAEARQLLDSIDTSTLPGLRDRASAGRDRSTALRSVSAVIGMRVEDYYQQEQALVAAAPGKRREAPLRVSGPSQGWRPISTPISPQDGSRPTKTRPWPASSMPRSGRRSARAG